MKENSINNLIPQSTKWKNLPTKAIRVPEKFTNHLIDTAIKLDNNLDLENNQVSSVQSTLAIILSKIENKEAGYKSNNSGKLINDIKKLSEFINNKILEN